MSDAAAEERRVKAAERQARLLAKSQARLEKITGAAKGEGRIISDCEFSFNAPTMFHVAVG
jgi:hypothetical protein